MEKFFLTYANYSTANDIRNIDILFSEIKDSIASQDGRITDYDFFCLDTLSDFIIKLKELETPEKSINFFNKIIKPTITMEHVFPIAFNALYAWSKSCEVTSGNRCDYGECFLDNSHNYQIFPSLMKKKCCIDCAQTAWIHFLEKICSDNPLEESLSNTIEHEGSIYKSKYDPFCSAFDCVDRKISIVGDEFVERCSLSLLNMLDPESEYKSQDCELIASLTSFAQFSLLQFLKTNGRHKIGRCPSCGLFFTKIRITRRYCSPSCKAALQRNDPGWQDRLNEYKRQRRNDPDCPESYW